jgi:hypothetical protein
MINIRCCAWCAGQGVLWSRFWSSEAAEDLRVSLQAFLKDLPACEHAQLSTTGVDDDRSTAP